MLMKAYKMLFYRVYWLHIEKHWAKYGCLKTTINLLTVSVGVRKWNWRSGVILVQAVSCG